MSVVTWEVMSRVIGSYFAMSKQSQRSHSQTAQIFEEYIPVGRLNPLPYASVVGKRKKLSNAKSENVFICIILIIPSASLVFTLVYSAL